MNQTGYLYIIGNQNTGLYKLGFSVNPKARLANLQASCPIGLRILALRSTERMHRDEERLHQTYADCRQHGEWFKLTPEQAGHVFDCLDASERPRKAIGPRLDAQPNRRTLAQLFDCWANGQRTLVF